MHVIFFMAVCINHTGQCYELEFYRFFLACLNNYEYFYTPYFSAADTVVPGVIRVVNLVRGCAALAAR